MRTNLLFYNCSVIDHASDTGLYFGQTGIFCAVFISQDNEAMNKTKLEFAKNSEDALFVTDVLNSSLS
jgi:hypothetical protein